MDKNNRRQNAMDKTARMNNAARQDEENRKASRHGSQIAVAERRQAEAEAEEEVRRNMRKKIYLTRVEYVRHMTVVQPSFMVLGPDPRYTIPSFMTVEEAEAAFDEAEKWSLYGWDVPSEHDRVPVQLPRPGGMTDAIMAIAGFRRNEVRS